MEQSKPATPATREYYQARIEFINQRILEVRKAKLKVERLGQNIFSPFLSSAIRSLESLIGEQMAERKHVEIMLAQLDAGQSGTPLCTHCETELPIYSDGKRRCANEICSVYNMVQEHHGRTN